MKKFSVLGTFVAPSGSTVSYGAAYSKFNNGTVKQIGMLFQLSPYSATYPRKFAFVNALDTFCLNPQVSPDKTKVAYVYYVSPTYRQHLRIYNIATGVHTQIVTATNAATDVYYIWWHPNSTKLIFQHNQSKDIKSINTDGTGITTLYTNANNLNYPKYNYDGSKIGFMRKNASSNYDLYVMNADGSSSTNIKTDASKSDVAVNFSWANLSNKIAFVFDQAYATGAVKTINSDGTGEISLTTTSANWSAQFSSRAWSLDDTMVFHTLNVGSTGNQLYKLMADGSGESAISPTQYTQNSGGRLDQLAVYSDGRIYYIKYTQATAKWQMATIKTDGTDFIQFDDDVNDNIYQIEDRTN